MTIIKGVRKTFKKPMLDIDNEMIVKRKASNYKFYMLNTDMVHHSYTNKVVYDENYMQYINNLPHFQQIGKKYNKGSFFLIYEYLYTGKKYHEYFVKESIELATTKNYESNASLEALEQMIELGVLEEISMHKLKPLYPHISKRVCNLLGWNMPKNQKQRYKMVKDLELLEKETEGQTRLLWHHDYYDGPRSGVMLWKGEKCWFEFNQEYTILLPFTKTDIEEYKEYKSKNQDADIKDWRDRNCWYEYIVYRIPAETMEVITYNHELFRKYVGTHTDYNEEECSILAPIEEHSKFYNDNLQKEYKLDLSKCEKIGMFKR